MAKKIIYFLLVCTSAAITLDAEAKGRKKILSGEARGKNKDATNLDFDEATIDGQRRNPGGIAINKSKGDNQYDLINLRRSWHPEMIKSTTKLEKR